MTDGRHRRGDRAVGRGHSSHRTARRLGLAFLALLFLTIGGGAWCFHEHGYRVWVVHTGSMEPMLMPGDIVIDSRPTGHYHRGEVITFLHSYQQSDVVTHRVAAVAPDGTIFTKGDANATRDAWQINPQQVQGEFRFDVKDVGYLVVFLQQPSGIASLATSLIALVLLWRIFFPPVGEALTLEDSDEPVVRVGRHADRNDSEGDRESPAISADSESWRFDLELAGSLA